MRDVTSILNAATQHTWSYPDTSAAVERLLAEHPSISTDWDKGARERWLRCLEQGYVIAFIGTRWPIAIFLESHAELATTLGASIRVLTVTDMDKPELQATPELLERFAGRPTSEAFPPDAFSASDLVWLST